MTATILRRKLADLKLAETFVRSFKEHLEEYDKNKLALLMIDLANIEVAINMAHEKLLVELKEAGLL